MTHKSRMQQIRSGEPVGNLTPIGNGHARDELGRIFKLKSLESEQEKQLRGYMKRDKRIFSFSRMQEMVDTASKLSNKHAGYMLMLFPHIQYRTNILVSLGRKENQIPLTDKDLAEVFGINKRYVSGIITELKEIGVITETREGYYKVNERYHFRGRSREDTYMLVKTFHTTLNKIKVNPAELGVLYKLLPYIHYESNLVCENPFEDDPRKVRFLNTSEIAGKVGLSRQKLNDTLRKLVSAGAIATIQRKSGIVPQASDGDGRETVVLINPYVITRKREDHSVITLQLFSNSF